MKSMMFGYIIVVILIGLIIGCGKGVEEELGNTGLPKSVMGKDGAPMVLIPAGEFLMGSNDGIDDEKPVHKVYLDSFYMDVYEVTNEQYKKFIDATGYETPKKWNDPGSNASEQPVVYVFWHDAEAYCEWAGKRLPTEAEWEKAAGGGLVEKSYPWGDTLTHNDANYYGIGGWQGPVGSFAPNGYGLYDMAGNVTEWCADWYERGYYRISPYRNPKGPSSGKWRVRRGGSCIAGNPTDPIHSLSYLRVASRNSPIPPNYPCTASSCGGFRCVQDVKP